MKNLEITIETQFGMRVRYLRKKIGLSIEELALNASINPKYLSDIERGKRNPTLKILSKISMALGISLETLMKGLEAC